MWWFKLRGLTQGMGSKRTLSQIVELTGLDILFELPIPSLRVWRELLGPR